jgi:F-type H+-transporting ATPase subunit gamma
MQSTADVKRSIKTVAGIGDVCRTLSTVASARLSQTRERAAALRLYAGVLRRAIVRQQAAVVAERGDPGELSPFLQGRPEVRRVLVIAVGADRGLCGGYNITIGRFVRERFAQWARAGVEVGAIVRGRRLQRYVGATGARVLEATGWTRKGVTEADIDRVLERATEAFLGGEFDEVWACYTSFHSVIQHEVVANRLLPIAPMPGSVEEADRRWFYEPDRRSCTEELLAALVRVQMEAVLLEAFASEQAARMVTTQEAAERADKVLADLRTRYNRLRREAITSDLIGVLVAGRLRAEARDDE